jgi:hypothetical protein
MREDGGGNREDRLVKGGRRRRRARNIEGEAGCSREDAASFEEA